MDRSEKIKISLLLFFTLIVIAISSYFLGLIDSFPANNTKIIYGPVISSQSGGEYALLWITDKPIRSSVSSDNFKQEIDKASQYHYYKIDAGEVEEEELLSLKMNRDEIKQMSIPNSADIDVDDPSLPFVGYGEVEGLPNESGFAILKVDGFRFISAIKDGRWGIDFPEGINRGHPAEITIYTTEKLFETKVDLRYVQPAQLIVLNPTIDRVKPQSTESSLPQEKGLIPKAYACTGDGESWKISCPNGQSFEEEDACVQDMFKSTHANGYDQWSYEACGCPLKGDTWTASCNDGASYTEEDMCVQDLFIRVHGRAESYNRWQTEACQEHGGPAQIKEQQEGAGERLPFEKTPPQVSTPTPPSTPPPAAPIPPTTPGVPTPPPPSSPQFNPNSSSGDLRSYNPNYPDKAASVARLSKIFPEGIFYWSQLIVYWSDKFGFDPNLFAIIMYIESCGNPNARSYAGAMGLFQVMPFNFTPTGTGFNYYDPDTNAYAGAKVFRANLDYMGGDIGKSFAGYNYGPGRARSQSYEQWPAETRRYYDYGTTMWSEVQKGSSSSSIVAQKGQCSLDWLGNYSMGTSGATGGGGVGNRSSESLTCFEPDTRNRCTTDFCKDKIGESCTPSNAQAPDSCVYGGVCVGGKCVYDKTSGCQEPHNDKIVVATEAPEDNSQPVQVTSTTGEMSYNVIEYGKNKNTGTFTKPAEYVVLHWTGGRSALSTIDLFEKNSSTTNYAANYMVESDGTAHYVYPIGQVLYHAGNTPINENSLSFENEGTGTMDWDNLTKDQVNSNVQEIIRHIRSGALTNPENLKVIGHFEAVRDESLEGTKYDPGPAYVAAVCKALHEREYKVQCNHGVSESYNIRDSQVVVSVYDSKMERFLGMLSNLNLIGKAEAEGFDNYSGPGFYNLEFKDYQTRNNLIYLVKDPKLSVFYEDINGNGAVDMGEQIDYVSSIKDVRKVSETVAINLKNSINLVSFPKLPENVSSAGQLVEYLNVQGADVLSVSKRNNGQWQSYITRDGKSFSDDFQIRAGEVYFIKAKYQTSIMVDAAGADIPSVGDIVLERGWNPITLSGMAGDYNASDIVELFEGENVNGVFYWDGGKYQGITLEGGEVYGKDFLLLEGQPYWVRVR